MEWDLSRVFSAVNAEEVKIGSKVYLHGCISGLKELVINESKVCLQILRDVKSENESKRFVGRSGCYALCYLIEEPAEPKLKWTDLKIGDVIKRGTILCMVQGIDYDENETSHISVDNHWLTDKELEQWEN